MLTENLPIKPIQAIISIDKKARDAMSTVERCDSLTNLFLGLTKAVECGARVDLSNPERIVVTKI